uniref:Transmembrane protein n=1 Tax=Nelumbo nucifera TaxID=4432 RepID=A0A822YSI9_NELNU|nr:TPA_asm: hypothetical protein HUJ06_005181 [Nelumbo nucifera]
MVGVVVVKFVILYFHFRLLSSPLFRFFTFFFLLLLPFSRSSASSLLFSFSPPPSFLLSLPCSPSPVFASRSLRVSLFSCTRTPPAFGD